MGTLRLTKNELRDQQHRLSQLKRYLPTLQLKKAMLQAEVHEARLELEQAETLFQKDQKYVASYRGLMQTQIGIDPNEALKVEKVNKHTENIAGIEVPYFDSIIFEKFSYSLFVTPPWLDAALAGMKRLIESEMRIHIAVEKKQALEEELRQVSIRVNLFEKILIPRALQNIKKIKIFLGDQQLAAVSQAKIAKEKIEAKKL